jgi:cyanate permease
LSAESGAATAEHTEAVESAAGDRDLHDWGMLALSWMLYFAFSFTLASLFPIVGTVREDLNLTYAQAGIILGGWQIVYLLAAIPIGYLVDRYQPKVVLFVGALLVAASQLGRSYAQDFTTMLIAVALLGLGGPVMSVGLPKVISEFFTGRHRATASGVYITGAHIGQMTALAATAAITHALADSWRTTLRWYSVVVVAIALVWVLLAKRVPRHPGTARVGMLTGMRHVATVPGVWLIIAVGFAGFLASHGYRSWLPEMLATKGISTTTAGLMAATPALFGMVGSIVIVRYAARTNRRIVAITLLATVGVAMLAAVLLTGPAVYVAIAVEGFCAAALMPLMMNTLMEMREIGPAYMGAAAGLYFTIGEMGGFAGPSLIGITVGLTGGFVTGIAVLSAVMWLMIVAAARIPTTRAPAPATASA